MDGGESRNSAAETVPQGTPATAVPSEQPAKAQRPAGRESRAVICAVAGWLVPGLGHALQKMWARALAVFLVVGALVSIGAGMRGNLFTSRGDDPFETLGYVADAGAGSFYFLARALEPEGADVSSADGDDGTRFIAAAGVLNLLAALHAYEASRGRKA